MTDELLRIGVLGAARIAELSIVGPARAGGHRLVAVAARARDRAEAFAATHGVERVVGSYADLVADPEIEVVYNPLANSMLAPWAGGAPRLVAARGGEKAGAPGVDEWLYADLEFPGGVTGTANCHLSYDKWQMSCRVVGTRGEATVMNFVQPHLDDRVVVR